MTKEDKDTLKGGKYLSDFIISVAFALYEIKDKQKICKSDIVLVRPEIACLLKKATDHQQDN